MDVPPSGTPSPHEQVPEWRATLMRVAAWRTGVGMNLSDTDLARHARSEFERVGGPFYGYHAWECVIKRGDGTVHRRVVLAAPDGRSVLKDAATDAEALGVALAEHLARKRR